MAERRGFRRPTATAVLTAIILVVLIWLVLYPNLFVLADSVLDGGRFTTEHYARFLGSRSEREALWNSVWISLASVVLSALIGVPLAFLFALRDFPGRRC